VSPVPEQLEVKNAIIELLNGCTAMLLILRQMGAGLIAPDDLQAVSLWFNGVEKIAQKWIDETHASGKGGG
jgi:hypothetical protein